MDKKYFYENETYLKTYAMIHQITSITVTFEGSGDSGSIDFIQVKQDDKTLDPEAMYLTAWIRPKLYFDKDKKEWVEPEPTKATTSLHEFIANHVYQALEETEVDWYNNDGGYGEWRWDPVTGVDFDVQVRITETQTAYCENRRLGVPPGEEDAA